MEHYVIIIGAMKSGTTTLFSLLANHPQIAPAKPKEPGFFAFDDTYAKGWDWYHGLFDFDPDQHRYRLDGSTDYTKAPFVSGVWDRMRARPNARFKLIYIMRHPLRRLESHAAHVQLATKEVGQEITGRADHGFDNGVSLASLAMTRYAAQLDEFAAPYQAGDVYLTTLEDLSAEPGRVCAELTAFLALDTPVQPVAGQARNTAAGKKKAHPAWVFLTRNAALTGLGKRLVPEGLRTRLKARFQHPLVAKGRFRLTATEETGLTDLLAPDLRRLETVYQLDVARLWGLGPDRDRS